MIDERHRTAGPLTMIDGRLKVRKGQGAVEELDIITKVNGFDVSIKTDVDRAIGRADCPVRGIGRCATLQVLRPVPVIAATEAYTASEYGKWQVEWINGENEECIKQGRSFMDAGSSKLSRRRRPARSSPRGGPDLALWPR